MTTTARGIRNHNPGNIERVAGVVWEGEAEHQGDERFVCFSSPKWGIRAIARVLITYADARRARDGSRIDTVQEVIERWAPPVENDSGAYAAHVRARLGVEPGMILDIKRPDVMRGLIEAIIAHENGQQPYTDAQITAGMVLAGIEPDFKPLNRSRTVNGGRVAGTAGAVTTAVGVATQVAPALPVLEWVRDNLGLSLIVAGIAVLAGVGYMIWARYDDRRNNLR